jgi:hypothetical protein
VADSVAQCYGDALTTWRTVREPTTSGTRWPSVTFYVFGWTWWPFDGAVIAALIALAGTLGLLWFNAWSFGRAERRQTDRHKASLAATERVSAREHTLARFREALDSNDTGIDRRVEFGHALLESLVDSEWLTPDDKRLAARTLARPRSKSRSGGGNR